MGAEPEVVDVDDAEVEIEEGKPQGSGKDESKAMDKITDHVNDSEIDASKVQDAMLKLAKATQEDKKKELERDRELAKVKVNPEDITVIAQQFEVRCFTYSVKPTLNFVF
ncbi:hypothetical protein CYMTET_46415 [Cymbomonas tetramitiformis]|uniref:Nascent polypeptide-associated complex subunit alpha-like UBA domain-containing protein n=1 Tax=Cymbomonas tetramitiformis TaxID=36881 RepID=A0AAE0BW80_9CHLO|nr:hypothetical protein CYMTET_46415 [Cymbomonas tetramitiformis]